MATEHALSKSEFDTLTKLLARAHMSGDTAILEKHVEREYYNIASDGFLEKYDKNLTGGMSEAAKRRIEAELESEFEIAAGGNGFVDGRRVAMGQVGAAVMPYPGSRGGVNIRVVVPGWPDG